MEELAIRLGIAIASMVGTLVTVWGIYRRNKDKLDTIERVSADQLKVEIEEDLWKRLQAELERVTKQRDDALIIIEKQREYILELETSNARLRRENEQCK